LSEKTFEIASGKAGLLIQVKGNQAGLEEEPGAGNKIRKTNR
jgi:hypothetical protein